MYCRKCGFITKGIEDRCPYCGAKFIKDKKIDEKIFMFSWFEVSIRQIIFLIAFNLFALFCILDLVLIYASPLINFHITPWSFLSIFGILYLFNEFIYPSNNTNRYLFLKTLGLAISFSTLFMVSYPSWIEGYTLFNKSSLVLTFGYFYPCFITMLFLVSAIRFIVLKNFNVFSTFFYVSFLLVFSLVLFILTFIDGVGLNSDNIAKLIIYINFALTLVFSINALIFAVFRMKSRFSTKS